MKGRRGRKYREFGEKMGKANGGSGLSNERESQKWEPGKFSSKEIESGALEDLSKRTWGGRPRHKEIGGSPRIHIGGTRAKETVDKNKKLGHEWFTVISMAPR